MNGYNATILDEDGVTTLAQCNDCGRLTFVGNELCGECGKEEMLREEWEKMHPEHRCPPRE